MNQDVHIYLAVATPTVAGRYPRGQSHALHIYVRVPAGSDFDGRVAEAIAMNNGWLLTEIRKAGRVNAESLDAAEDTVRACVDAALKDGSAILVYDNPISAAG